MSQNYTPIKKYTKFFLRACRYHLNLPAPTSALPHLPAKPQSNQTSPDRLPLTPTCSVGHPLPLQRASLGHLQAPPPCPPPAARGSWETHMAKVHLSHLPPGFWMKASVLRAASAPPSLRPPPTPPPPAQARLPVTFPLECALLCGDWVVLTQ